MLLANASERSFLHYIIYKRGTKEFEKIFSFPVVIVFNMCYNDYSENDSSTENDEKRILTMKTRKKYFVADFVTDLYFLDDEAEMFYAESPEAVEKEVRNVLGEHLLALTVRKATWRERRRAKKNHYNACIVH